MGRRIWRWPTRFPPPSRCCSTPAMGRSRPRRITAWAGIPSPSSSPTSIGTAAGSGRRQCRIQHRFGTAGQRRRDFSGRVDVRRRRRPHVGATGDFNRDGKLDLVVSNYGNADNYDPAYFVATTVSVLLGNGDGTFQAPQAFEAGSGPNAVAVGDFNSDGLQDLAVADYGPIRNGSNTVSVLLGQQRRDVQGAAGLRRGQRCRRSRHRRLQSRRQTGSGRQQLLDNNVSVLLGNGNGAFQPAGAIAVGANPWTWSSATSTAI